LCARRDERGQLDREPSTRLDVAREDVAQVHALHVLHHDVEDPRRPPQVVHLHDVLVHQVGDELGLADEHAHELVVARVALEDRLDRDRLLEPLDAVLDRLVHVPHAPTGDRADDRQA
jgi:hypothetical protein